MKAITVPVMPIREIGAKRRWRDDCGGSDRNGQEEADRERSEG